MKIFKEAVFLFIGLSLLTGVIYPLAIFVAAQMTFRDQANGSLVTVDNQTKGSSLIAQKFESPRYFWPRPSAADYATVASGASNLAPTSQKLADQVEARRAALGENAPQDLLFASGSGLDPHISLEAAQFQTARVAQVRGLEPATVESLIRENLEEKQWGIFGKERVNVLKLNMSLDAHH